MDIVIFIAFFYGIYLLLVNFDEVLAWVIKVVYYTFMLPFALIWVTYESRHHTGRFLLWLFNTILFFIVMYLIFFVR